MKTSDLVKLLNDNGFWQERQKGGHAMFKNDAGRAVPVPVAGHHEDLPPNLVERILRSANLGHALPSG